MTLVELFSGISLLIPFCIGHFWASHPPREELTKNYPPEEINITKVKLKGFGYSEDLHYGRCPKDKSKGFCFYKLSTNSECSTIHVYPECEYAWNSKRYEGWTVFSKLVSRNITISGRLNEWTWCNRCGLWHRTTISKEVIKTLKSLTKKCPTNKREST